MAICIDPPAVVNPMIDGVDTIQYYRPFMSITEVKNWEFNNPEVSRTKTYKIGYRIGLNTDRDIVDEIKLLHSKINNISKSQMTAFQYGLRNGRTVQNLMKTPAVLG